MAYTPQATELIKITLPSGSTYDIVDARARELIEGLGNPTHFLGESTTAITDGSDVSPITIKGKEGTVTPQAGDIVVYGNGEFIYSGSAWIELGDLSGLGGLAHKDTASMDYTPEGDVSQPTFSGEELTATGKFTPEGSVSLTTAPQTVVTGVSKTTDTVQGMKTAGSVVAGTAPTFTEGAFSAGSLPSIDKTEFNGGTLPSFTEGKFTQGTLPSFTEGKYTEGTPADFQATVSNGVLAFSWTANVPGTKAADTFDAGALPTKAADSFTAGAVASIGDGFFNAGALPSKAADTFNAGKEQTVTLPTFEEKTFVATVAKEEGSIDVPSSAAFTGTEGDITAKGTPTGTVSKPTFTGTQATITVS